jgi:hypothetical protein
MNQVELSICIALFCCFLSADKVDSRSAAIAVHCRLAKEYYLKALQFGTEDIALLRSYASFLNEILNSPTYVSLAYLANLVCPFFF